MRPDMSRSEARLPIGAEMHPTVAIFPGHLDSRSGMGHAIHATVQGVLDTLGEAAVLLTPAGRKAASLIDLYQAPSYEAKARHRLIRSVQRISPFAPMPWLAGPHDVFHSFGTSVRPRGTAKKLVMTLYDLGGRRWHDEERPPNWTGAALRHAACVTTISQFSKSEICTHFQLPADVVKVIYLGCDFDRFHSDGGKDDENSVCSVLKDDSRRPYIVCSGGQTERKNVSRLLEAFAKFSAGSRTQYMLVITGVDTTSPYGLRLLATAQVLGIIEQVRLPGYLPDVAVPALFRSAAAVAVPSLYEGFGLPVVQGMACGTPVLCSDSASLPEVAGEGAFVVNAKSVAALAAGLARITSDQPLREWLRHKGLERAATFTWERCVSETIGVYEDVARQGNERPAGGASYRLRTRPSAPSRRRILLLPSAFHPHKGGVEELTRQLALTYRRSGNPVLIVAPRWPRSLPSAEEFDEIRLRRIAMPMPSAHLRSLISFCLRSIPAGLHLLYIATRWRPDLVHVMCVGPNGLYALVLARCLRLPVIVTSQGEQTMDATGLYQRSRAQRWVLRRLLRRADAVTACSADALANLKRFGTWDVTSEVIPNGISPEEATLASEQSPHPRSYIFALGRQVQNKGFAILLKAFAFISNEYPDVDLILAGDGPEHQNLVRQADQLGLGGRVIFPGLIGRAAVATFFRHCRIFVLPSFREPFGMVVLEAMLAGKPLIATNAGGVPEFVIHEQTGLLVPPEVPDALANAMRRLLREPALAQRLAVAGQDVALSSYTWPRIAAQYMALYQSLRFSHQPAMPKLD